MEFGRHWVEDTVLAKAEHLSELLRSCGMRVDRPGSAKNHSGIVIASSPAGPNSAVYDPLLGDGNQCSLRGNGVRLSPHYCGQIRRDRLGMGRQLRWPASNRHRQLMLLLNVTNENIVFC